MAAEIIKVKLGDVTQSGQTCENPTVTLIGAPGVVVNCANPDCNEWEIQLPEGFDEHCLQFSVTCDNCTTCPAKVIEYCFCETDDECSACETCQDGVCTTTSEDCCLTDTDCPCNQVCVNNECVCPSGYQDCGAADGCCDECCNNDDCGVCEVCRQGNCVPKECPDGEVCDPGSGDCVGCNTDEDCGTNECCVNNACDCCEGYVRDTCTGECVPAPDNPCRTNGDCDECYSCVDVDSCTGYGSCQPAQCPAGKVFSPLDGVCCHTPCNCGDPGSCPTDRQVCTVYSGSLCICLDCGSGCDDSGDCRDGCYCDDSDNCVVSNCSGACVNGTDCEGEGCGCLDGQCVSCASIDCVTNPDDCARTLGCECNGNKCKRVGCSASTCQTAIDCGLGCTCVDRQCVNCDNFTCVTADCSNQEGCVCVNGECEGEGVDCADSLSISKNDTDCVIQGKLTTDRCCGCPPITALLTIDSATTNDSGTVSIGYTVELFQGKSTNSFDRLDNTANPTISQDEDPQAQFNIITPDGTSAGATSSSPVSGTLVIPQPGSSGTNFKFDISDLRNEANKCDYDGAFADITISNGDYGVGDTIKIELTSDDCKDPLFTWSKSGSSVFADGSFRKVYVSQSDSSNMYVDVLPDGDTEGCNTYSLQVDCGCAKSTSKYIVFCQPEFILSLDNCNTLLNVDYSGNVCSANSDVTWNLIINGSTVVSEGSPNEIKGSYVESGKIESASVTMSCSGECIYSITAGDSEPAITIDTPCTDDTFSLEITGGSGYILEYVEYDGKIYHVPENDTENKVTIPDLDSSQSPPTSGTAVFRECGSVEFTFGYPGDCCDEVDVSADTDCNLKTFMFEVSGMCNSFYLFNGSSRQGPFTKDGLIAFKTSVVLNTDYIVITNCPEVCSAKQTFLVNAAKEDCCDIVFSSANVTNTTIEGTIQVAVPASGGSGEYEIRVEDGNGTLLAGPTTVNAGDDPIQFSGITGTYEVILRDVNYTPTGDSNPICPELSSGNVASTNCENTTAPIISVADCTNNSQTLKTQLTSGRTDCPCPDYDVQLTWDASYNATSGRVSADFSWVTPDPVVPDDLIKGSDGWTNSTGTLSVSGPTSYTVGDISAETENITYDYTGAGSVLTVSFTNVTSAAGCVYSGNATFNLAEDGTVQGGNKTQTLTLSGVGATRKTEVVYFEDPVGDGSWQYFDRSIDPLNNFETTTEQFVSGSTYQAATVCDCVLSSTPDCEECVDITWGASADFTVSAGCGDEFTIDITNNSGNDLTLSSDQDVTFSPSAVGSGTTEITVTGPFEGDDIVLTASQGNACSVTTSQKTISGLIAEQLITPDVDALCVGSPATGVLIIVNNFGWELLDNDGAGSENEKTINDTKVEGLIVEILDGGGCSILYTVPDTDCGCENYTLGATGGTCISTDTPSATMSFRLPNSTNCDTAPANEISWTLTKDGGACGLIEGCSDTNVVAAGQSISFAIDAGDGGDYVFTMTDNCGCTGVVERTIVEQDCCITAANPEQIDVCPGSTDKLTGASSTETCAALGSKPAPTDHWHICEGLSNSNCSTSLDSGEGNPDGWSTIADLVTADNGINANSRYTFVISTSDVNPAAGCTRCWYNVNILAAENDACEEQFHACNLTTGTCAECDPAENNPLCLSQTLPECAANCSIITGWSCTSNGCQQGCTPIGPGCYLLQDDCKDVCECFDCTDLGCVTVKGPECGFTGNNYVSSCDECDCTVDVGLDITVGPKGPDGCLLTVNVTEGGLSPTKYSYKVTPASGTTFDNSITVSAVATANSSCFASQEVTCTELVTCNCGKRETDGGCFCDPLSALECDACPAGQVRDCLQTPDGGCDCGCKDAPV